MSYLEIPDTRVQAYAPVTARLIRNFRDNENSVRVSLFAPPLPAYTALSKNSGDAGLLDDPPVTFFDIPNAAFKIQLLPGQHGERTHLTVRPLVALFANPAGFPSGYAHLRLSDGTDHGPVVRVDLNLAAAIARCDWAFPTTTFGLRTFKFQAGIYALIGLGQTIEFRLQWSPVAASPPLDSGFPGQGHQSTNILRGGSTDAAISELE